MDYFEQQRQIEAKKILKRPPGKLEEIDLKVAKLVPTGMTRAFRNNRYTIMIYDYSPTSHGPATKVLCQKHDNKPFEFHWREMQAIKNEIFGEETTAVEYLPATKNLMDTHNIYWFWIFPDGVLPIPFV